MSETMKDKMIRFVADLKREDNKASWEQVAERCREKFPKAKRVSLTANAIRKRYNAWLNQSAPSQPSENDKESRMLTVKDKNELVKELMESLEDAIEDHVRGIIERVSGEVADRVFEQKFAKLQKVPTISASDNQGFPSAPPLPETVKGTRRHTIQREKIAGTVDASLLDLFENERRERGYNVSRMLDVVLWNYFSIGKAEKLKLSFERSELSDNKA